VQAAGMLLDDGGTVLLPDGAVVYLMLWARPCPTPSTLEYATFADPFFETYCRSCHSAQRQGAERADAPDGLNFDTLDEIRANADTIFSVAADANTLMPQAGPVPTHDERIQLGDWLACGAH
jgi:uncharacterized membrane protein